jgi:hypothetical protein
MILARQMLGENRTIRTELLPPEDSSRGWSTPRYISLYHALCNTNQECRLWAEKDKPLQFKRKAAL